MRKLVLALLPLLLAGPALAQGEPVAFDRPETATPAGAPVIQVTSPAIRGQGEIAFEFSRYGRNVAPPVAWAGAPRATKSYVLIMEDADGRPRLVTHWTAWNIAGEVGSLARATKNGPEIEKPDGVRQGRNDHGGFGYTGPHPPEGDPPHAYHIQLFALDRRLGVPGGAGKAHLLAAMRGHVIAKGEVVGRFTAPKPTPTPPAPAR